MFVLYNIIGIIYVLLLNLEVKNLNEENQRLRKKVDELTEDNNAKDSLLEIAWAIGCDTLQKKTNLIAEKLKSSIELTLNRPYKKMYTDLKDSLNILKKLRTSEKESLTSAQNKLNDLLHAQEESKNSEQALLQGTKLLDEQLRKLKAEQLLLMESLEDRKAEQKEIIELNEEISIRDRELGKLDADIEEKDQKILKLQSELQITCKNCKTLRKSARARS